MNRLTAFALLAVGVLVLGVGALAYRAATAPTAGLGGLSKIDNRTFASMNVPPAGVTADAATNTITVSGSGVTLLVEASPLWYPHPSDFFLMYGLANPTLSVGAGTQVRFLFINMDNETHTFAITTVAPPYSYMPMMEGGMMSGGSMMSSGSWPLMGPMLSGVSGGSANPVYNDVTLAMTFPAAGTFWYLCLYPGHAADGMYGETTVQAQA